MTIEMIRPTWSEFTMNGNGGYVICNCSHILQTFVEVREHWQAGHFDYVRPDPPKVDDDLGS